MGIFDPPTKSIMKRMPPEAVPPLASVQTFAESEIPDELGPGKKAALTAMVMATWVTAHRNRGSFVLSEWNAQSVITTYKNCTRLAGPQAPLARQLVARLIELGMFPEGVSIDDPGA